MTNDLGMIFQKDRSQFELKHVRSKTDSSFTNHSLQKIEYRKRVERLNFVLNHSRTSSRNINQMLLIRSVDSKNNSSFTNGLPEKIIKW